MIATAIPQKRLRIQPPAGVVGLFIGLAAATPGAASPISGLPIRPWHVFILLAFFSSLLYHLRRNRPTITKRIHLDLAVMAFAFATLLVEIINANDLNFTPDYATVTRPVFWLIVYWSVRMVLFTVEDAQRLLKGFVAPVFPSVLLGFGQVLGVDAIQQLILQLSPDSGGFMARLEDGRLIRATALVQHWTSFGSYLCTITAAAVSLLILARVQKIGSELYAWMALGAAGLGALTTFTLSSIITVFAIFVLCSRAARSMSKTIPLLILIGVAGVLSVGSLLGERLDQQFANADASSSDLVPSTLQYRYRIWQTETIPMISERPWTGWGNNVYDVALGAGDPKRIYPVQLAWHSPESQWLNLLMNSGAIGLMGYLLILALMARLMIRSQLRRDHWSSKPIILLFVLMLLAAFTAPVFTNHGLPIGLWALLGVLAAYDRRGTQEPEHA